MAKRVVYSPRITVLHAEDDEKMIAALASELVRKNIFSHAVNNLEDAIGVMKKCGIDLIISDGTFPARKGEEPSKCFIPLVEKVKKLRKKLDIIAWSDSTHVHEYCRKHGLPSFSKGILTKAKFEEKGREFIKVERLEPRQIAELIEKRLLEKIGFDALGRLENYYTEPATVLAISMAADMRTGMFKRTAGLNYSPLLTKVNDGLFSVYMDRSDDKRISDLIHDKIVKHGFFPKLYAGAMAQSKRLLSFSRGLKAMDYSGCSNKKLAALYLEFCRRFMEMRIYSSLPTALEHGTSRWTMLLKEVLGRKVKAEKEANNVFSTLTTPEKISYVKGFELEIAKVGVKRSAGKDIKKDARALADRYAWINYTFEGVPITEKDVLRDIGERGKTDFGAIIAANDSRLKRLKMDKSDMIRRYGLTKREVSLFKIGADIVFLKFYRKGVFAESYHDVEFLLEEIAKRIGCSRKQAVNMLPGEVLAALELGSFHGGLIDERMKDSLLFHRSGQTYALSKDIRLDKHIISVEKAGEAIRGQTAYPGKVAGRVKIINIAEDMKGFKEGEILVSRSTNPSLVSAMAKAAAIVTDLGGLTCHAAIVAREMGKPCVVGTGNATKALKDGDMVKVDADKGVVRKVR